MKMQIDFLGQPRERVYRETLALLSGCEGWKQSLVGDKTDPD